MWRFQTRSLLFLNGSGKIMEIFEKFWLLNTFNKIEHVRWERATKIEVVQTYSICYSLSCTHHWPNRTQPQDRPPKHLPPPYLIEPQSIKIRKLAAAQTITDSAIRVIGIIWHVSSLWLIIVKWHLIATAWRCRCTRLHWWRGAYRNWEESGIMTDPYSFLTGRIIRTKDAVLSYVLGWDNNNYILGQLSHNLNDNFWSFLKYLNGNVQKK